MEQEHVDKFIDLMRRWNDLRDDKEISSTELQTRSQELEAEWRGVEEQMGRKVGEDEIRKHSLEHYALVGNGDCVDTAYGVIRVDRITYNIERFNIHSTFEWEFNADAWRYLNGLNDDGEPVTKEEAEKIVEMLTKKWKK